MTGSANVSGDPQQSGAGGENNSMKTNPQYQAHDWLDTNAMAPKHGIDALVSGRWMHCAENGKPLLYDTEKERDAKLRKLRRAAGRKSSSTKPRHSQNVPDQRPAKINEQ